MRRGEVRWYRFAQPDKRRPVVVLTRDSIIAYLGEVTVAPVTSTIRDIPSEVLLSPLDGMSGVWFVQLDWCGTRSPQLQVEHLDEHRKRHREIDVALRNVSIQPLSNQGHPNEQQKACRART